MNKGLFTSLRDDWSTPQYLFDNLNSIYHFTLDPCSNDRNFKVHKHYTIFEDGLSRDWSNEVVFMNPPYGRNITKWVKKAYESSIFNNTVVVALLPARTDTYWFHDFIYNKDNVLIEFIRGRLRFGGCLENAPFPSMLVYFKPL